MTGMTCGEFGEVVHGIVRMELFDVALREKALDHAARCSSCAERMEQAGLLAEATEAVGRTLREQQAPPSVETAVLAAFRSHHRRAAWRRTFEWSTMAAAAVLGAVFLWTSAGPSKGPSSPAPRKDVSSQGREPLEVRAPVSEQYQLTQGADVVIADASTAYTTSDFLPVTFTEGISPVDPGVIVRVQLTRASLAELGYPLADTPDDDLIPADVLVGEDGWPRAVRLVQ